MKPNFGIFSIFVFIILLSLSYSCKKKETELKIYGKVYESNQSSPLNNVKIVLSGKSLTSGVYNPFYNDIASATTDVNGNFEIKFKNQRSESYRVSILKENYFSKLIEFSGKEFEVKPEFEKNFNLIPVGFINLRVKNVFPDSFDDKIIFYFSNSNEICEDCCSNIPYTGIGPLFDTTFTCKFYGNETARIFYSVTKDNKTFVYNDTVWCPAFTTVSHTIEY